MSKTKTIAFPQMYQTSISSRISHFDWYPNRNPSSQNYWKPFILVRMSLYKLVYIIDKTLKLNDLIQYNLFLTLIIVKNRYFWLVSLLQYWLRNAEVFVSCVSNLFLSPSEQLWWAFNGSIKWNNNSIKILGLRNKDDPYKLPGI